jgi:hypothetical protein
MELAKGRPAIEIDNFVGPNSQREVVDFVMVQRAIALGGMDLEFEIRHGNFDARNLKLLASGSLLVSFDSIWLAQAQLLADKVYISKAVVKKGDFWAGVYTAPTNTSALKIKTLSDLRRHSAVSSKIWRTDWQTWSAIKPAKLVHESNWFSMAKLVSNRWIDVMLVTFPKEPPFVHQDDNFHLVAVEGVKVILDDSRHYCVSRQHPLGAQTFAALERGLEILQQQGAIERAYRQSGFINDAVKDWKVLNPATK